MSGAAPAIVGVLLAAGRSRRFGGDKLQHRLPDGRPIGVAAADSLRPACDRLLAVVRPDAPALHELLGGAGCELVICRDADSGMGHSLAAAIRAACNAAGWVVALADMPFITTPSHQLIAACLRGGASLAATEFQGRRGHPVGFAAHWRDELSALRGEEGARSILQAHRADIVLCPVSDRGVLRDIDRRRDVG